MTPAEISVADRGTCESRIESLNEFLGGEGGRPERVSADKARAERAMLAERLKEIEAEAEAEAEQPLNADAGSSYDADP